MDERLALPSDAFRSGRLLDGPADAWHGGLALGLDGAPPILDHVNPTWMLNARLDPSIESTSWRVSLRAVLVRGEVLRRCGAPDPALETVSGAALDLGFRWTQAGAVVRHVPDLAADASFRDEWPTEADGVRIVRRHRGRAWAMWAAARSARTGRVGWRQGFSLVGLARTTPAGPQSTYRGPPRPPGDIDRRVSVILPTIDRYRYLGPLLTQLDRQTVPVHEVIVVDQTPTAQRRTGLETIAPDLPVTVIVQPEPGQCTARNAAILSATGDAFLFVDDDDEIPDDLVEQHLRRLVPGVDASCGGIDDANAGPPPEGFRARRVSDVFPTNNVMVTRAALERSGLFDPAYDRGPRADHDVGMRLFLAGCTLVCDPTVLVFHHRTTGGLRTHQARRVTAGGGTTVPDHPTPPATTEVYLWHRYFDARQVGEAEVLNLLAASSAAPGPGLAACSEPRSRSRCSRRADGSRSRHARSPTGCSRTARRFPNSPPRPRRRPRSSTRDRPRGPAGPDRRERAPTGSRRDRHPRAPPRRRVGRSRLAGPAARIAALTPPRDRSDASVTPVRSCPPADCPTVRTRSPRPTVGGPSFVAP